MSFEASTKVYFPTVCLLPGEVVYEEKRAFVHELMRLLLDACIVFISRALDPTW